jgi:DNA-binding PadR family transcriptional regulator
MFDHPWPFRRTDPETSKEPVKLERPKQIHLMILKELLSKPMNAYEVSERLPLILYQSITPRAAWMLRQGLVEISGYRKGTHRAQRVWKITQKGIDYVRAVEECKTKKTVRPAKPRVGRCDS